MKCKQCNEEHTNILNCFMILFTITAILVYIVITIVIKNKNDLKKLENRNNPIEEYNNETSYT